MPRGFLDRQETPCMKWQNMYFVKNKKNTINLASAKFAQRVLSRNIVLDLIKIFLYGIQGFFW